MAKRRYSYPIPQGEPMVLTQNAMSELSDPPRHLDVEMDQFVATGVDVHPEAAGGVNWADLWLCTESSGEWVGGFDAPSSTRNGAVNNPLIKHT